MFDLGLLCLLCAMGWLLRGHAYARGKLQINPVFAVVAGTFYYVVLPCVIVRYFSDLVGGITVYDRYFTVENATFVTFFWALVLACLSLGLRIADPTSRRRTRTSKSARDRRPAPTQWMFATLCTAFVLLLLSAFSIRDSLFAGYDEFVLLDEAVWQARGTMSSLYSVMAVFQLGLLFRHGNASLARRTRLTMLLVFVVSSGLLLSMGARLYVVMAMLSAISLYSLRNGGIGGMRFFGVIIIGFTVFGGIGVLRAGALDGLTTILMNVATEPMLTSISMFSLITDNPLPWIGQPWMLPADFQAALPSLLFPGKALLFDRLSDYGYAFEAPLGGYHLIFSALINFGVLGTLFVAFLAGLALGRLARRQRGEPDRAMWTLCCVSLTGMLAFSIFRDPFFISVVKNVFVVSILVPWVVERLAQGRPWTRPFSQAPHRMSAT